MLVGMEQGLLRGLAQAGANGVWIARQILERYEA